MLFPLFCLYFCLQKPSLSHLLHLFCYPLPCLVPFPTTTSTHPTSHFLLTVFVSVIASERQKFVCAQDPYNIFMCRSTLHRWEPFNPKVIHACICIRKHGARRPRQDCSMLYMHTYFPPLVLFLTHALMFEQTEKKKLLPTTYAWNMADLKALSWINISHIYIHMFVPQTRLFFC